MDFSQLKMISIGIVADDKADGERYVEVYPIELLPFVEGGISSEMFSVTRTGLDFNNNKYSVTLHRALTVKADWIGETHRVTSPNVMKGEQVKLYSVGSGERYYWEPLGRDDHLRTTETVTYAFAAREKGNTPITADDCYTITVDSKNKHITLQTSKVDGEYCRYTAQLNLADGNITTMDDLGNVTQIDSKNTKMTAKNADGTFFTLNKKNLELYAPNDFIQKIEHDVKITVGNDWIENVGGEKQVYVKKDSKEFVDGNKSHIVKGDVIEVIDGDKIINVEGSITESVTGDITIDATNVTETLSGNKTTNAVATTEQATTITKIGILSLLGSVTMGPGAGGSGSTLTGDMKVNGDSTVNGNFTVNGTQMVSGALTCNDLITPTWNGIPQADHLKDT